MCLFQLSNYLRHLISYSLRTHASDPHRLRTAAASLAACADAAPTVLPPDLGVPLSHGDAAPLLSRSVFPTPMHAQSALQSLLCAEGHASEVLLAAGFRTAGAARCLRFSRMLACFLRADPELRRGHFVLLAPTFAAGKVLLAEAALLRGVPPEGEQPWERTERMRRAKAFEGGARTVARALRRLASGYGFQARRVSEAFDAAMLESGLVPALPGGGSSSSLGPEEWEEAADSDFIADVLLLDRGERGAVLGRAVSGSVASVLASSLEGGAGKGPGSGSGTSSVDVGVV
ncbi:hypothetical protein DFJ74DRAFT_689372 [Hyaloraphidium curvatum]|nr:hypothetical protein DFJ74DRAFT_689372 [Hyaloraphidium curvatum]